MIKVGYAVGTCGNCGKKLSRPRPAEIGVCDCFEYCPFDHGNGSYGTQMQPYTPDLTPQTYNGNPHPIQILFKCPICEHLSTQQPVEVKLE